MTFRCLSKKIASHLLFAIFYIIYVIYSCWNMAIRCFKRKPLIQLFMYVSIGSNDVYNTYIVCTVNDHS